MWSGSNKRQSDSFTGLFQPGSYPELPATNRQWHEIVSQAWAVVAVASLCELLRRQQAATIVFLKYLKREEDEIKIQTDEELGNQTAILESLEEKDIQKETGKEETLGLF